MTKLDFQPMPKRFMVWDKFERRFHEIYSERGGKQRVFDIWDLEWLLGKFDPADSVIVQSANLFDRDDEEIFEGSIVRVGGETGIVQMVSGKWHAVGDDDIPLSVWKPSGIEILGHILSNPELLEQA